MLTVEQKIEIAEKEYIKAIGLVKRLFILKHGGKEATLEYINTLYNFESALQGILIYVAIVIDNVSVNAERFIKDNNITGDVFRLINSMGKKKLFSKWNALDWNNIFKSGIDKDILLEIVKDAVGVSVQNFVFPLSQIDADISAKSFASELSEYIKRIIQAFCSPEIIRGDMEHNIEIIEKTMDGICAGMKIFNETFQIYWKNSEEIE